MNASPLWHPNSHPALHESRVHGSFPLLNFYSRHCGLCCTVGWLVQGHPDFLQQAGSVEAGSASGMTFEDLENCINNMMQADTSKVIACSALLAGLFKASCPRFKQGSQHSVLPDLWPCSQVYRQVSCLANFPRMPCTHSVFLCESELRGLSTGAERRENE